MTTAPQTATAPHDLLARAESYLSAMHGSVARHDNLAANLACAGCELRDQIRAALAAPVVPPAPADQAALRERLADAIGDFMARECTICGSDYDAADAVLAVLPLVADWAAVLREAADRYQGFIDNADTGVDPRYWTGIRDMVIGLHHMAAELRRVAAEEPS